MHRLWMIFAINLHIVDLLQWRVGITNPPAPKVLGRDLPDGTRKRLQVYLGGGAFFGQNLLFLIGRDARLQTRWSPRTRMLTRMLMVQMSKHMVMQWRTIPFWNSLFEQSCTCFPCYQSAVWSGKCRVWSVECEVRSVECKVWSGECRVCNV